MTGLGSTLVTRLARGHTRACRPRGPVLVPTRELAAQVQAVLSPLAGAMGLTVAVIFGGTLNGRRWPRCAVVPISSWPARGVWPTSSGKVTAISGDVEVSVLDEADQMADLGFLPEVRRLLGATPSEGQRLLFSATLDG